MCFNFFCCCWPKDKEERCSPLLKGCSDKKTYSGETTPTREEAPNGVLGSLVSTANPIMVPAQSERSLEKRHSTGQTPPPSNPEQEGFVTPPRSTNQKVLTPSSGQKLLQRGLDSPDSCSSGASSPYTSPGNSPYSYK